MILPAEPVVVTGLGTIGPSGAGREPLASALRDGRAVVCEVDRSEGHHRAGGARNAALVPQMDLSAWLSRSAARRMSRPSQMAVAASAMALEDAGFDPTAPAGASLSVALATAFGSVRFTERIVRQILLENPEAASPALFTECVANAAAGEVAIVFGAGGANVTITQRSAGPLLAVSRAAAGIRSGKMDRALAGAVEEMPPLLHAVLDRFNALARTAGGEEAEAPRPFDRRRNGFLAGEGATVVHLERESEALARGARILARIAGSGGGFDPTATASDWGTNPAIPADRFVRTGLRVPEIDRIVCGAAGSVRGDRAEAGLIRALWKDGPLPPVLAPKAVTGEYGGGTIAPALLALEGSPFGGPDRFEPDPALSVVPHGGGPLDPPRRVLASSVAPGGAASWCVFERVGGAREETT